MDRYDDLKKLQELRDAGTLSDAEFEEEKARLLGAAPAGVFRPWGMEVRSFCMLLHLSQFAGFIVPFAGLVLPVVMWLVYKDESEEVDAHGRVVVNWIISVVIYSVVSFILMLVLVGFLLFPALLIVNIVFVILGTIRASEGKVWAYPLSIPFFGAPLER